MGCTTILIGKEASYDGSTMIARTEDSGNGTFNAKQLIIVQPDEQPRDYVSVISHCPIKLPDDPLRYSCVPNVDRSEGNWSEAGINCENVAMTATETITTNARVLGADPLVPLVPAVGKPGDSDYKPEIHGGIGEEDLVTIVLPYIHSARDGVRRLGGLLEKYGTYESNGIGFSDADEIWWLETIGGHHWIARRLPDDCYSVVPNQLGIDDFDMEDAFGDQKDHMCSADLREFIKKNHLNVDLDDQPSHINPRNLFGSSSDADRIYNTPRAWWIQRTFNPYDEVWDGPDALHRPSSGDLPWCRQPEHKISIEDAKYALSGVYQDTPYFTYKQPFAADGIAGDAAPSYRPIGINRTGETSCLQIRKYAPYAIRAVQWLSFGSNAFTTWMPFYTNVDKMPDYVAACTETVSTDALYWNSRIIAALADTKYADTWMTIYNYIQDNMAKGHFNIAKTDEELENSGRDLTTADEKSVREILEKTNQETSDYLQKTTSELLKQVLYTVSLHMHNAYFLSDN